jgi:hypothetical protein
MEREGVAPCILNLGTGWQWVVIFMPRLLDAQGTSIAFLTQLYIISKMFQD